MPVISDKILQQMQNIGQPRTSTTTSTTDITQNANDPFNLGQLGLLLYLLLDIGKSDKTTPTTLATQASGIPSTTGGGPSPAPAQSGSNPWEQIAAMLQNMPRR